MDASTPQGRAEGPRVPGSQHHSFSELGLDGWRRISRRSCSPLTGLHVLVLGGALGQNISYYANIREVYLYDEGQRRVWMYQDFTAA